MKYANNAYKGILLNKFFSEHQNQSKLRAFSINLIHFRKFRSKIKLVSNYYLFYRKLAAVS